MTAHFQRLQGVLLDWAGTTVDFGSLAPALVFRTIFARQGIEISMTEAREPMGLAKRDHIAAILALPRVREEWRISFDREPTEDDVIRLYRNFLPLQKEALRDYTQIIPGVIAVIEDCRRRGLKIGSTTGYTRELMEVVVPLARDAGYEPDVVICSDDCQHGRPAPDMNLLAAERLGLTQRNALVAVDDTNVGMEAAHRAGMWAVGVTETGNGMGVSEEELQLLPSDERARRHAAAESSFHEAGADFVIRSVAELTPVLEEIETRLAAGVTVG